MEDILLNATLKEKISAKKGTKYIVVEIELSPTLKKDVFLDPAEVEVVKMTYNKVK